MRVTRLYIPSNLDLTILNDFRKEYRFKLLFVISTIYFRRVTCRAFKVHDFIPLSKTILARFIRGNDVKRVREDLVGLGIIEVKPMTRGKFGHWSIGYRLTESYRAQPVKDIACDVFKDKEWRSGTMLESEAYIRRNLEKVTIIAKEALEEADQFLCESTDAYNCAKISVEAIEDRNWFSAHSENTGRVFNNVTNLKSELRKHLRFEDRSLVEVDISNCQPLLMYHLYTDKDCAEAKRYRQIVEAGAFNEIVASACGVDVTVPDARKKFKVSLLTQIFMPEWWEGKLRECFYELFPQLANAIKELKKGDHARIARLLQKLESNLIVETIVPLCATKSLPLLTIHDSILTLPEHVEAIRGMICSECERLYGVVPSVKIG